MARAKRKGKFPREHAKKKKKKTRKISSSSSDTSAGASDEEDENEAGNEEHVEIDKPPKKQKIPVEIQVPDNLKNINELLQHKDNNLGGWFDSPCLNETEEKERIQQIKLKRKDLGIKVSARNGGEEDVIFSEISAFDPDLCPPPLPLDVFQKDAEANSESSDIILPSILTRFFQQQQRKKSNKIMRPSPIQAQAWPVLFKGRCNLLGVAPTGSGKTLAYSLPLVQLCLNAVIEREIVTRAQSKSKAKQDSFKVEQGPIGLILSPTRELAQQIGQVIKSVIHSSATPLLHEQFQKYSNRFSQEQIANYRPMLRVTTVYGGNGSFERKEQQQSFLPGEPMIHIISATPGRMVDLIGGIYNNKSNLRLDNVAFLVIDEADRMLQMGFVEQVSSICEQIRPDRVTCMLSATLPQKLSNESHIWFGDKRPTICIKASTVSLDVKNEHKRKEKSGSSYLTNENAKKETIEPNTNDLKTSFSLIVGRAVSTPPQETNSVDPPLPDEQDVVDTTATSVEVSTENRTERRVTDLAAIPSHIAQILHVCAAHKKPKKLIGILAKLRKAELDQGRSRHPGLLVVFFGQIKILKIMSALLSKESVKCRELHGKMKQSERERALADFKAGKCCTLLATDVAARGIHVNNVEYIVNYDFPTSIEQYVHRCGRAARNYDPKTAKYPGNPAGCVYSFFTRDLAPMAPDILALLKASSAWIDPNLLELAAKENERRLNRSDQGGNHGGEKGKDQVHQKRKTSKTDPQENLDVETQPNNLSDHEDDEDQDLNYTGFKNAALKRADHVSDVEDSDGESNQED